MTKIPIHPLDEQARFLWSIALFPLEIVNIYILRSWTLSSSKQRLLAKGTCQNGDSKSVVVVGLSHNSLKSFLHWRRLNLWLTVQTGISDLDLVRVFTFLCCKHIRRLFNGCSPWVQFLRIRSWWKYIWISKNVSRYTMCVPKAWRPFFAARRHEWRPQHPFRCRTCWEKHW